MEKITNKPNSHKKPLEPKHTNKTPTKYVISDINQDIDKIITTAEQFL